MDIALRGTHKMGNHVLPARVGTVEHVVIPDKRAQHARVARGRVQRGRHDHMTTELSPALSPLHWKGPG